MFLGAISTTDCIADRNLSSHTKRDLKPIESSARNQLICIVVVYDLCGLRAKWGERSWREKWPGESGK